MEYSDYQNYLKKKYGVDTANEHIAVLNHLETSLSEGSLSDATYDAIVASVKKSSETYDAERILSILQEYVHEMKVDVLARAVYEFNDAKAFPIRLLENIKAAIGEERSLEIASGIKTPQITDSPLEKTTYSRTMMNRLNESLDHDTVCKIYGQICHGCKRSDFSYLREKFLKHKNIDAFLDDFNQEFVDTLYWHRDNNAYFCGQLINDTIIDFIVNDPDQKFFFKRKGSKVYNTKMPYCTLEYIQATDDKMKKYYACYCMWARQSILQDEGPINEAICSCSLGYTKMHLEAAFDREIEAKNIEVALQGNSTLCTVVMHIPEDILKEYT